MAQRKTERFEWKPGDFTISDTPTLPEKLKTIVANAPEGDKAIGQYLSQQVSAGKITLDDVEFLIDSGALA